MILSITSRAKANGRPSTIGGNEISIEHGGVYTFSVDSFTTETNPSYKDPEDDALSYIKIMSLPSSGALELNNVAVNINDLVSAGSLSLGHLTFTPDVSDQSAYLVSFQFDCADTGSESLSGLNDGIMKMNIQAKTNEPPSNIDDYTINQNYGEIIVFSEAAFSNGYSDPENDPIANVKILSLPSEGLLTLDGEAVVVNQIIPISEIEAGYLTFNPGVPSTNNAYQLTFTFAVSDTGSGQFTQ